jgi:hypothetical protein
MNTRFSNPAPPLLLALLLLAPAIGRAAGGGADYGRGPETDPVATAALVSVYAATNALTVRMTAAEGATNALDVAVTALQGATGSLDVAVTALQGATGSLDTAVTSLQGATNALDVAVTALQGATNAIRGLIYGEPTITGDAGAAAQLLLTNVFQTVNVGGSTPIAGYAVLHVWVSETDMGAASTNNIEALTLSGGTAISTVTANADYWYLTSSAGAATAVVEGTASATTNYLMVAVGHVVNSKALVFPAP